MHRVERFVEVAFGAPGDATSVLSFLVESQRKNAAQTKEGLTVATDGDRLPPVQFQMHHEFASPDDGF